LFVVNLLYKKMLTYAYSIFILPQSKV